MIECSRVIEFDAAHRVMGHENKCKYLHGHRYKLIISFISQELDNLGRVIDFGTIKSILGKWIDENWDHNAILWKKDELLGQNISAITNQKIYYLDHNPTAENMSQYLLTEICPLLFGDDHKMISSITLYETPNCFVSVTR
jgi:6-pyruvoyltetrahydropterin/6-carboxytetrahydropterin synthase